MATPWLPYSCLTSREAAAPMARLVREWTSAWFAGDAWHVLGSWDQQSEFEPGTWQPLRSAKDLEISGAKDLPIALALAILGHDSADNLTARDRDLMRALSDRALDDLAARVEELVGKAAPRTLPDTRSASVPILPVFSLLIGQVGNAQIVIECALPQLVAMVARTFEPGGPLSPLDHRDTAIAGTNVAIAARLGTASISLKDLAGLEQGDLLLLDREPSPEVELLIEDQPSSHIFHIQEHDGSCSLTFQGQS